jgi:hypothetical protein
LSNITTKVEGVKIEIFTCVDEHKVEFDGTKMEAYRAADSIGVNTDTTWDSVVNGKNSSTFFTEDTANESVCTVNCSKTKGVASVKLEEIGTKKGLQEIRDNNVSLRTINADGCRKLNKIFESQPVQPNGKKAQPQTEEAHETIVNNFQSRHSPANNAVLSSQVKRYHLFRVILLSTFFTKLFITGYPLQQCINLFL